ncbi:unnamed protein product [Ectocarpus sp. 12 AP-2014]
MRCSAATHTTSEARHSADNVTAAYTLVQQAAAQKNATSRKTEGRWGTPTTQSPHCMSAGSETPLARQGHETNKDSHREPSAISNWSVANIGFNDINANRERQQSRICPSGLRLSRCRQALHGRGRTLSVSISAHLGPDKGFVERSERPSRCQQRSSIHERHPQLRQVVAGFRVRWNAQRPTSAMTDT